MTHTVAICVPTLNPGKRFARWLQATLPALNGARLLVIDSSSDDDTVALARAAGAEVVVIKRSEFDHGATRDMALRRLATDIVVFMTQDALPASTETISHLVSTFKDASVGAAFGRQLPHDDATPIAAHARLFNYAPTSYTVGLADASRMGIKTVFLSNSFAAYRRDALLGAGGFPHGLILAEDMLAGARLLKAGWRLAYCADACVKHSHNYSLLEEMRRYFDIGVLHGRERWLLEWLGRPEGEGMRFVRSECRYLLRKAPWRLPEAGVRSLLKYLGYRLGHVEADLPLAAKRRLSMQRSYWHEPT